MKPSEYETMFSHEDVHWWFVGTRNVILDVARDALRQEEGEELPRVLDVGCGTGATLARIQHKAHVTGIELERAAAGHCRSRGLTRIARARGEGLPFADDSFDLVLALDVIEHIDDDRAVVDELYRVAKPGAMVLFTVPAHPFLWSRHDEALHHRRRYRKKEFRAVISHSGLAIEKLSYYNATLFPPIVAVRMGQRLFRSDGEMKSDVSMPSRWINGLLARLLGAERWWLRCCPLPFGVSLIARARKPGSKALTT